jgi:hypothetical protein
MTNKSLVRRLERLEDRLLPTNEEPIVLVIHAVDADGRSEERIRFTVPASPRPAKTNWG